MHMSSRKWVVVLDHDTHGIYVSLQTSQHHWKINASVEGQLGCQANSDADCDQSTETLIVLMLG